MKLAMCLCTSIGGDNRRNEVARRCLPGGPVTWCRGVTNESAVWETVPQPCTRGHVWGELRSALC